MAELPATSTPVLNADDPAIAALGGARAGVLTFGIDDPSVALPGASPTPPTPRAAARARRR